MKEIITEDSFNRLAISIISKLNYTYEQAIAFLNSLQVNLVCGPKIGESITLQAALLTAVNTGKRAFLGGVNVSMPQNVPCLLPWSDTKSLNEIIVELGGILKEEVDNNYYSLMFGFEANLDEKSLQIVCNDWQGGIIPFGDTPLKQEGGRNPLGGIAAGAIGIGIIFLKESGLQISAGDIPTGISIWRPDLNWLEPESNGAIIENLPKNYWLLGLGHLGQSYLWSIGFLPYNKSSDVTILLQDYDKVVEANFSAGLLCEQSNIGQYKARICSRWLESRGFETRITERAYGENTKCVEGEPLLALCGFDSAKSRRYLENSGFDLIIEAALGGNLSFFDNIIMHTFPDSHRTPLDIWPVDNNNQGPEVNKVVLEKFQHLNDVGCGVIAQNLASKSISSSFIGALAGTLVIGEALRGLNGGKRYDTVVSQIRNLNNTRAKIHSNDLYQTELSRNGFQKI